MLMPKELPKMTVEKRESENAHGIPAPDFNRNSELMESIILNEDAKSWGGMFIYPRSEKILQKHIGKAYNIEIEDGEIEAAVQGVLGFSSWQRLSKFIVDDMCMDIFNLALKYCLGKGFEHKDKEAGFIDGSGIGYANVYIDRLKETLEKCFDAKYYFQQERPLEYAKSIGIDLTEIANAIHPGHWSYPAGHGCKFLTLLEVLDMIFVIPDDEYRKIAIALGAAAMARSGSLIHDPSDNLASMPLVSIRKIK